MKVLFILCLLIGLSLQENFIFNLEKDEDLCLDEYFSDRTLIIYEINSNVENMGVKILDPNDTVINEEISVGSYKHAFTSFTGGYYQCCIINKSERIAEIYFTLKSGVDAKDYSSVAKTKDLKPIELDVL